MKLKRKHLTAEFKACIAREGLREEKAIQQIAQAARLITPVVRCHQPSTTRDQAVSGRPSESASASGRSAGARHEGR